MVLCYKTFVSIGNGKQSFIRLLNAVQENADLVPKPTLIQCGHTQFSSDQFEVNPFVSMDDFIRYVAEANLLILHAGAGSVLHAIRAGKRPIVMPRTVKFNEVVNDHQIALAKMLHDEGKVIMVQTTEELASAINKTLREGISLPSTHHKSKALDIIGNKIHELVL